MHTTTPFIITPDDDLLTQHPMLKQLSSQLALKYAYGELVTDNDLQVIGSQLWRALDCDEAYDKACSKAGLNILPVIIASNQASIQQLPWEALYHPQKHFMGKETAFTLSRQIIATNDQPYPTPIEKGPLRILLFTSLTEDSNRLDIEKEQEQVQEALLPWISEGIIQLEMPDDGRFSTFKDTLKQLQPHLVFLSGHGKFYDKDLTAKQKEDYATFAFEAETTTNTHEVKGNDLADAFIGTAVQCVVLSACQSGMSASDTLNTGLMQQLALKGIPHVIGMRESIFDTAGTQFAREFLDQIGQQARIDIALQSARLAITQPLKDIAKESNSTLTSMKAELSFGQWCLPLLISQSPERALIDWQFEPQKPEFSQETLKLQNILLASQFIGRRKEIRDLVTALQNQTQKQLLITGAGGQGKTALAGQLAQKLQRQGWMILAWSARPGSCWSDFIRYVESLLDDNSRNHYISSWWQDESDKATALLTLLATQAKGKLLVFFDNLESIQNPTTREIEEKSIDWKDKISRLVGKHPNHFSTWISAAQQLENKGVSLLLTSRWKIPQWQDATHLALEQCSYNDYLALARQKPELQRLLQDRNKLRKVHNTLHGNARALEFFAVAMQDIDDKEEDAFLQQLALANAESQADMALAFIVKHRSPAEKELLNRLQAYSCPVAREGVVKLSLVDNKLEAPTELLNNLLNVSLLEKTFAEDMQCEEYQCSSQVRQWLNEQGNPPPARPFFVATAEYHAHLFQHERRTIPQAIILHQALQLADETIAADKLALDTIVGNLNRQGFYQTILEEWLPNICESQDPKTRGEALGQTGKQYHHIGDYETALKYLKQSLQIQQEIGDKSGEGTTLNNISQIFKARGDYETALKYAKKDLAIMYDIGDQAGLCISLFNMGHTYLQNEDLQKALSTWTNVYEIAKPMNLAQVLQALESLAGSLGLEGGLQAWESLAEKMRES